MEPSNGNGRGKGRPRKGSEIRTEENADTWERATRLGFSIRTAAQLLGCTDRALLYWQKEDPDIFRRISKARAESIFAPAARLFKMMSSDDERIALDAIKFHLARRSPDHREKQEHFVGDEAADEVFETVFEQGVPVTKRRWNEN